MCGAGGYGILARVKELFDRLLGIFTVPAPRLTALAVSAAVVLAGALAYRVLFGVLARFARRTPTTLDDARVRRMRLPAVLLVGLLGVHAYVVLRGAEAPALRKVVVVIESLLAAYLVIEAAETMVVFYWLGERKKVTVPAVVRHLALVVIYSVVVLSILGSVAGIDVLPVLATSTVITVVLGLSLQDTLGNLVAGLALHVEKPFEVGDWILVDGTEGKVVYMGWRSTRIRTFSADIVALPNSIIAKARVQNFYAPDRVTSRTVELPVALAASPEAVESAVCRACGRVERVHADPKPKVWLVAVTPLFQRYVIRFWMDDFQVHDDTESDLMKALWHECRAEGVALASPAATAVDADGAVVASAARA